jgi:hypothetical protein
MAIIKEEWSLQLLGIENLQTKPQTESSGWADSHIFFTDGQFWDPSGVPSHLSNMYQLSDSLIVLGYDPFLGACEY